MPAAVAIPMLVSAGTQIAGAAMASKSAKGAAKTQSQAADRALAVQRQIYGDQQNLMRPYVQAGQSAMSTLGRLVTPGPGARFAAPGMGAPQGPGPGPGPMVRLRAPDGEERDVPSHLAQGLIARGAQPVGGPGPMGGPPSLAAMGRRQPVRY